MNLELRAAHALAREQRRNILAAFKEDARSTRGKVWQHATQYLIFSEDILSDTRNKAVSEAKEYWPEREHVLDLLMEFPSDGSVIECYDWVERADDILEETHGS